MHVNPKTKRLICNVCVDDWWNHTVGGNCKQPPLPENQVKQKATDE